MSRKGAAGGSQGVAKGSQCSCAVEERCDEEGGERERECELCGENRRRRGTRRMRRAGRSVAEPRHCRRLLKTFGDGLVVGRDRERAQAEGGGEGEGAQAGERRGGGMGRCTIAQKGGEEQRGEDVEARGQQAVQ
eukprot:1616136-Rhodomonas_salina.5